MNITNRLSELVRDAAINRNRIVLILKNGGGWYEGFVEKIYEHDVVKFVTSVPGRTSTITGFLLLSDILDVVY
jgi:hypothetical protein